MKNTEFMGILQSVTCGEPAYLIREFDGHRFVRKFLPKSRLIILGGGHVAEPVSHIASALEFDVTVVDDRPSFANSARFPDASEVICDNFNSAIDRLCLRSNDYVVVVTRGHRYDADCLRRILKGTIPGYIGMMGSKRRVIELLKILESEGYDRKILDTIHTPIGVSIHAVTPVEIAVSICGELISERFLLAKADPFQTMEQTVVDMPTLSYLAENEDDKALMMVVTKSGSIPTRPGAIMTIDRMGITHGTIGGGCAESEIMGEARHLIGTGRSKLVEIDMSNDVAGDEGMVCGGRMQVLIQDISQ